MIKINNIDYADNLAVLFNLRQRSGCKTLQETYKILETTEIDTIIDILHVSYNTAHVNNEVTLEQFMAILAENNVGFIKLTDTYSKVVEALMYNGMSPEEIAERKNLLASLQKK